MSDGVWITGVGAVTPLGNDFETVAGNLLAGRSGVSVQRLFAPKEETPQCVGAVGTIPVPHGMEPADFARLHRLEQLALSCTVQAAHDAGIAAGDRGPTIGLVLGMGAEYFRAWELDISQGGNRVFDPEQDRQSVAHAIRGRLGLRGPAASVAAACASGGYALLLARQWVKLGWVDVCLAGACDLVTPMAYAGFHNLRALSRREDSPTAASRPFDADRDGFVMGEGGAVFALESAERARRRGAQGYGELAGVGATSDASHMVIPSPESQQACEAIRLALEDARIAPDEVDYVNAHAAGTPVGDKAEAQAIRLALGHAADRVPVSSTKSMTGHLLSGAAAIEALACLAAIRHDAIPPTINLDHPDPECPLDHVAHTARQRTVRVAASNSFGFGGSNTCLVFRKAA